MLPPANLQVNFVVNAQAAIVEAQRFNAQVAQIRQQLIQLNQQTGMTFKNIAVGMQRAYAQIPANAMNPAGIQQYNQAMTQALQQVTKATPQATSALSKLGTVGQFVFGSVLGISAITALRGIVQYFGDAAKAGYEFAKAMFALQAGVNAMRRTGTDITTKGMLENIQKLRKEFNIFSTKELVVGTAALLNLTRDFGFAAEQVYELQQAIVKLAIINGRAMDEVQRTVALAISSGYTEGLQRLGVSINRINIAEKAASLGYADSYMALTELERSEATRILILEKTAKYQGDLNEYQKTYPGLIDASNASLKDLSVTLGGALLPLWALFMQGITIVADGWTLLFGKILPVGLAMFTRTFMYTANIIGQGWEIITGKRAMKDFNPEEASMKAAKAAKTVLDYMEGEFFKLKEAALGGSGIKEFTDEQLDAYEKVFREILDLDVEYKDKQKELEVGFGLDMREITQEYLDNMKKIWEDYQKEIININQDKDDDLAKDDRKLAQDIEDLNRDAKTQEQDAARKYHEQELKAERDYQEKLRKLREEFLFDLEDALRERDALQVLRLIRRYKLDVEQTKRGEDEAAKVRQENYRNELADIRRQREEKLRELQIEHERRTQEIELQRQKELEEAKVKYEEQKLEEEKAVAEAFTARQTKYAEDVQALKDWLQTRLNEIVAGFQTMEGVTAEMVNGIASVLNSVFGSGGVADLTFQNLNNMVNNAVANVLAREAEIQAALKRINDASNAILTGTGATTPNEPYYPPSEPHYAAGGSVIATKPTRAIFGDAGPELAEFTPLGKGRLGKGGTATIELLLSPDLEARMVDNTLGEVAVVMRRGR